MEPINRLLLHLSMNNSIHSVHLLKMENVEINNTSKDSITENCIFFKWIKRINLTFPACWRCDGVVNTTPGSTRGLRWSPTALIMSCPVALQFHFLTAPATQKHLVILYDTFRAGFPANLSPRLKWLFELSYLKAICTDFSVNSGRFCLFWTKQSRLQEGRLELL